MKTVLISGAGVAGLTAAYWLKQAGYAPTVIERAPAWRLGGQLIDVRGPALTVVERMGILPRVQQARTQMRGVSIVDARGVEIERITGWTASAGRLQDGDVELLREDLTMLLQQKARDGIDFIFNDCISEMQESPDGVGVRFIRGGARIYDLVIGADGLHSKVRQLAFGDDSLYVRPLGSYLSVCSAPNFLKLDNWQIWHRDENANYLVCPVRNNRELRISFGFDAGPLDHDPYDVEAQMDCVLERFGRYKGDVPKLLQSVEKSKDFYFSSMAQVHMDSMHKGRVALVGDAGACLSPLAGQGTSLALIGAYVLADEIKNAGGDYAQAFARYEARISPFIAANRELAATDRSAPEYLDRFNLAKNAIELAA